MTEKSLYQRRENQKEKFTPQAVTPEKSQEENMTEFDPGTTVYMQKEIRDFRRKRTEWKIHSDKRYCKINRRFGEVIYGMAACNRICGQ